MTITTTPDIATIIDEYIELIDAGLVSVADSLRLHAANDIAATVSVSLAEAEDAFEQLVEAAHATATAQVA